MMAVFSKVFFLKCKFGPTVPVLGWALTEAGTQTVRPRGGPGLAAPAFKFRGLGPEPN